MTHEERAKAVQRIKVSKGAFLCTGADLNGRKIKLELRISISKWNSRLNFLLYFLVRTHLTSRRVVEALTDPKTWLFALFVALENVPNSLTNQTQIIVSSFGFTNLQTTLLGCVNGVIEIVTIFTGVQLASRIVNGRAYVGAVYSVPAVLGVFLINFLPWNNKIGLLFSQWLTGDYIATIPLGFTNEM